MKILALCLFSAWSTDLTAHDPIVYGNNTCYMSTAYFPTTDLEAMLPESMTIPDEATMAKYYPDAVPQAGMHPFMMSFCHGSGIHDKFTKINVPSQEELMFVFPVMYNKGN